MLGVADPNKTLDSFRIRLACTLLDCVATTLCGTKSSAERLDIFITYMQRYYLALKHMPLDLHFALNDCLERVPLRIKKLRSLEEASGVIRKLEGAPDVDEAQLARDRARAAAEREAEQQTEEEKRAVAEAKRRAYLEEKRKREDEERKQLDRELAALMSAPASASASSSATPVRSKGLMVSCVVEAPRVSSSLAAGAQMGIPVALLQKSTASEFTEDGKEAPPDEKPAAAVPARAPAAAAATAGLWEWVDYVVFLLNRIV